MKSKFKCKSNAQKYAIRAYYAKKNKAKKQSPDDRERYMKVMAEDFSKDFLSDDEWDYIEAMAQGSEK